MTSSRPLRTVAGLVLGAALLLSGCARNPQAELNAAVTKVTTQANARDAAGLRRAADDLVALVNRLSGSELDAAEATRIRVLAQKVKADADRIDPAVIGQEQAASDAAQAAAAAEKARQQAAADAQAEADAKARADAEKKASEQAAASASPSPSPSPSRSPSPSPRATPSPTPTPTPTPTSTPTPSPTPSPTRSATPAPNGAPGA